mgnify:CR=1 FL=1
MHAEQVSSLRLILRSVRRSLEALVGSKHVALLIRDGRAIVARHHLRTAAKKLQELGKAEVAAFLKSAMPKKKKGGLRMAALRNQERMVHSTRHSDLGRT